MTDAVNTKTPDGSRASMPTTDAPSPPRDDGRWALRLSVFFGCLCLIYGVHMAYLPVWLDSRGLSKVEIAVASAAPMFLRLLVTPTMAFAADQRGAHRDFIIAAAATGLALLFALAGVHWVPLLIVLVALMQVSFQTIMPLADAITLSAAQSRGLDYGRIRLWGSLTFIVAGYIASWAVAASGAEAVLWLSIAAGALTTAAALVLPRARQAYEGANPRKPLTLTDALAMVRDRRFLLFLLAIGAIQSSHAVLYVFGILHWRAQGLSAGYVATLWGIGVVAEVVLFWYARKLATFASGGAMSLIMLGGIAGLVRWTGMAWDPGVVWLFALQLLHAFTFAATHLGTMNWIQANVPPQAAATAQAVASTMTAGLAMAGAMLISGPLYAAYGGRAFLAMVALCALGLAAGLAVRRIEKRPPC